MIEGYLVWIDKKGKWHSSHQYALNDNNHNTTMLLNNEGAVQVWQIPLPDDLPSKARWFERQRAIGAFRSKAISIAKLNIKSHSLKEKGGTE